MFVYILHFYFILRSGLILYDDTMVSSYVYRYTQAYTTYVYVYPYMALMSLRSRSRVKAFSFNEIRSFIYTQLYMRSLLNISWIPIVWSRLEIRPFLCCLHDALANR